MKHEKHKLTPTELESKKAYLAFLWEAYSKGSSYFPENKIEKTLQSANLYHFEWNYSTPLKLALF